MLSREVFVEIGTWHKGTAAWACWSMKIYFVSKIQISLASALHCSERAQGARHLDLGGVYLTSFIPSSLGLSVPTLTWIVLWMIYILNHFVHQAQLWYWSLCIFNKKNMPLKLYSFQMYLSISNDISTLFLQI